MGAFTFDYRKELIYDRWVRNIVDRAIPITDVAY